MKAVLPGRFDPLTVAHVALIRRAAALFPSLTIAVAPDAEGTLFPVAERLDGLRRALADLDLRLVEQGGSDGELLRALGGDLIVRGLRPVDAATLPTAEGVETVYLPADPATSHIRSRLVRDIIRLGGDATPFLASG